MPLKTIDAAASLKLYQSLLRSIADTNNASPALADNGLVTELEQMLEIGDNETSPEVEARWFRTLSTLIDQLGARSVIESLAMVFASHTDYSLEGLVDQVVLQACMRHQMQWNGRPYEAHLMLVPVMFRGPHASCFPSVLHQETVAIMQPIVQKIFESTLTHGEHALVVPMDILYTLEEFKNAPVDVFHTMLAKTIKTCCASPILTRPRITVGVDAYQHGLMDEHLIDLSDQSPVFMRNQVAKNNNPAVFSVAELPKGLWLTVKLLPVVVFWPSEKVQGSRTGPEIADLGPMGKQLAHCIALCGQPEQAGMENALSFEVNALGIFSRSTACLRASMALAREALMGNLLRTMPFLDKEKLKVHFVYTVNRNLLEILVGDGSVKSGVAVHLPNSAHTQIYIESMAQELHALGIHSEVNLGDGMLRMPGKPHTVMQ